jgi:hypothetical protein
MLGADTEPGAVIELELPERAARPGKAWANAALKNPVRPTAATVTQRLTFDTLAEPRSRWYCLCLDSFIVVLQMRPTWARPRWSL